MSNVRGPFVRSDSDASGGEPKRIPIGVQQTQRGMQSDHAACELPAPTDQGRLYKPPHPIFGITFVYVVAAALSWGAVSGGGDVIVRLALTFAALSVCLVAAVHWLEGVELAHVPHKLGWSSAPRGAWWIGGATALASLAWLVRGGWTTPWSADPGPAARGIVLPAIMLLAAATWTESFYRGFVFRRLMRRHGFALSAGVSALLLAGAAAITPDVALRSGNVLVSTGAEIVLSVALCALFWIHDQTLGPALVVRIAVFIATWGSGSAGPACTAALVLLVLVRAQALVRARLERSSST